MISGRLLLSIADPHWAGAAAGFCHDAWLTARRPWRMPISWIWPIRASGGTVTVGNDDLPMVPVQAGRAMAESSVARAREAYERFAEAGEMALNAFETSMSETFQGWRSVMGSSRETAHQLSESNVAGARRMREQWEAAGARLYNAFEDNAAHTLAAMREIGHRVLVASDTNIRANLDFAERIAQAADAREVAALNVTFLQEQARRLTDQMVDLHQTTSRLAREAAVRTETP
jgi:hypothetical protein